MPICLPEPCLGEEDVVVVIVEAADAVEVAVEQAEPVVEDKLAVPFFIRSFFICSNCLHIAEKEKKRKGSKKNKRITTKQTIFFLIGRLG